ncbi:P-loop NTPase [Chitinivibrio alkaliphilus]|uniref:Flagellar synthesis regulator FleN n=1 Tax=Chitinivibrio alkaliphilus ACht1 TaxID=1313304 RepID=U7DBF6_9BACT|nr:P-loop NTPase [Chitinivibrio alkaliphilus]ERP38893.1 flagellar synthesis regulator FleN [Chitinivibrio alkaliphilus ACht1]
MDQADSLRTLMQQSFSRVRDDHSTGTVLSITSGKGGVGKSNVSIFLARAFAQQQKRILLLDGDMGVANLHILLGCSGRSSLGDFFKSSRSLGDIVEPVFSGVDLITGLSGEQAHSISPERTGAFLTAMGELSRQYDYLIIDGGAGIGRDAMDLAHFGDMTLLVITPEPTSLADAYAVIKLLQRRGRNQFYVVVNMADSDDEGAAVFEQLALICQKYLSLTPVLLGVLPREKQIVSSIRSERSLSDLPDLGSFTLRIKHVAKQIDHAFASSHSLRGL